MKSNLEERAAIDELVRKFFAAFSNNNEATLGLKELPRLFVESAIISKAVGQVEIYTVQEFIAPRAKLLNDGSLIGFREEETGSRTDIIGNVAQRVSLYRKSGVLNGERFEGRGVKVFQFVRTAPDWRIAAIAWDDEREGLRIPAGL